MDQNRVDTPPMDLDQCPVAATLQVIGGKWVPLILFQLKDGPRRFNALRRLIPGITQRMLTLQLRGLEQDGVVARKVFETVPPHVEYELTAMGQEAATRVYALLGWIEDALPQIARGWARDA